MALLSILQFPDPLLRRPCLPVTQFDARLAQLAEDMLATMYAAKGRGLAAPQVGVLQRLFVIDVTWKTGAPTPMVLVNPVLTAASDRLNSHVEGCLSIPGVPALVSRPAEITLSWQDLQGQPHSQSFDGAAAVCAQHELDHLNGRLCIDLMAEAERVAASTTLAAFDGIPKVPTP